MSVNFCGGTLVNAWINVSSAMNSLYNQALKQSTALQRDLDAFKEQITSTSSTAPVVSSATALQGQIQVSLTSFSRTIDDYDNMAKREIVAAKQEKAFSYVPEKLLIQASKGIQGGTVESANQV